MSASPHHPSLHEKVEDVFESGDLRLLYGMGVPTVVATAIIVGLLVSGATWLVPAVMVVIFAMTAIIILGFNQMLGEDEDEDDAGH